MKKILLALAGGLCVAVSAAGQVVVSAPNPDEPQAPCPAKGIRTAPAVATNPEPNGRLNTFNWYQGSTGGGRKYNWYWTVNNVSVATDIWMPWEQSDNPLVTHILGLHDKPEDGWELLKRDLGYNDQGVPQNNLNNPYVVLYNKYTGIMRVFVAVGEPFAAHQFAEIRLMFNEGGAHKAGTLNRMQALGTAVENTIPGLSTQFSTLSGYIAQRSKWFMADFPMDYDPCVCQFDSRLTIEVNLVSQADVKLKGVIKGTLLSTGSGSAGTTPLDQNLGSGAPTFARAGAALKRGQKTYKNLTKTATSIKKTIDELAKIGGNATDATNKKGATDNLFRDLAKADFLKQGLKAMPYVGAAVSALDYFFGGGKQAASPQQPVEMQPMVIEMNTTMEGTITSNTPYVPITFNNPGTPARASAAEENPYYNEILGVFSLVRAPEVDIQTQAYPTEYSPENPFEPVADRTTYYYKVRRPLQYVVNPASGLEVVEIQAALLQEGENLPRSAPAGSFVHYENAVPHVDPTGLEGLAHVYRTDYVDLGCLADKVFEMNSTTYYPDQDYFFRSTTLYLKLLVNLRRINAPANTQNVLMVIKYPVVFNHVADVGAGSFDLDCNAPLPPGMSKAALAAFCASQQYRDLVTLPRPANPRPTATPATYGAGAQPTLWAFPNPTASSHSLTLSYALTQQERVTLVVKNVLGQTVRSVLTNDLLQPGQHQKLVDISGLTTGMYLCELTTSTGKTVTRVAIQQ